MVFTKQKTKRVPLSLLNEIYSLPVWLVVLFQLATIDRKGERERVSNTMANGFAWSGSRICVGVPGNAAAAKHCINC